ncbi:MAG TPA: glutamyl-tRNA reductase [Verrucomicrobiae bacterium]|nr:glutamyl-tRNA reductase [Verrucomicrobiae bacterium]
MNVVVIGLSHHTSPVELRERFAFAESKIPAALAQLREAGIASEAVILSTCNRVEIYAATAIAPARAFSDLTDFLVRAGGAAYAPAPDAIYKLTEPQSLKHLFKVACGLDSMVLGETEILGQMKEAYTLAHSHKHTGTRLNKAFQRAFHVAKHVRTHTQIQRGSVSVASVGVELAERIFSSLADHEVLVIGSGEMSEKVARALVSRGVKKIVIAGRSMDRAELLAKEFGGRAVRFEDWAGEFANIDIAVSSTSAPGYILDRGKLEPLMKLRKHRPLLLIDIAVPRDIDPAVNFLENVYVYNIDDLQAIADDYLKQRTEEIATCEKIIDEKVNQLRNSECQHEAAREPGHNIPRPAIPNS